MKFAWWHWMVLALELRPMELVVPGLFIAWFGPRVLPAGLAMLAATGLASGTQIALAGDS